MSSAMNTGAITGNNLKLSIEDRGRTDRIVALSCTYALHSSAATGLHRARDVHGNGITNVPKIGMEIATFSMCAKIPIGRLDAMQSN